MPAVQYPPLSGPSASSLALAWGFSTRWPPHYYPSHYAFNTDVIPTATATATAAPTPDVQTRQLPEGISTNPSFVIIEATRITPSPVTYTSYMASVGPHTTIAGTYFSGGMPASKPKLIGNSAIQARRIPTGHVTTTSGDYAIARPSRTAAAHPTINPTGNVDSAASTLEYINDICRGRKTDGAVAEVFCAPHGA